MLTTEKPSGVARRVAAAARSFVVGLDRTPGANAPKPPNALALEAPQVHAHAKHKTQKCQTYAARAGTATTVVWYACTCMNTHLPAMPEPETVEFPGEPWWPLGGSGRTSAW